MRKPKQSLAQVVNVYRLNLRGGKKSGQNGKPINQRNDHTKQATRCTAVDLPRAYNTAPLAQHLSFDAPFQPPIHGWCIDPRSLARNKQESGSASPSETQQPFRCQQLHSGLLVRGNRRIGGEMNNNVYVRGDPEVYALLQVKSRPDAAHSDRFTPRRHDHGMASALREHDQTSPDVTSTPRNENLHNQNRQRWQASSASGKYEIFTECIGKCHANHVGKKLRHHGTIERAQRKK
jgi:hypothetical protein